MVDQMGLFKKSLKQQEIIARKKIISEINSVDFGRNYETVDMARWEIDRIYNDHITHFSKIYSKEKSRQVLLVELYDAKIARLKNLIKECSQKTIAKVNKKLFLLDILNETLSTLKHPDQKEYLKVRGAVHNLKIQMLWALLEIAVNIRIKSCLECLKSHNQIEEVNFLEFELLTETDECRDESMKVFDLPFHISCYKLYFAKTKFYKAVAPLDAKELVACLEILKTQLVPYDTLGLKPEILEIFGLKE
jgi:hypothetical protein